LPCTFDGWVPILDFYLFTGVFPKGSGRERSSVLGSSMNILWPKTDVRNVRKRAVA